jgi:PHD/YefM family antitoxin component YafN of YafNO toxin-antitoxin module
MMARERGFMASSARIETLPRLPASDVKKRGWRGVVRALRSQGVILVTNHDEPEAVILPVQQYAGLVEAAESRMASELESLRRRFDERLAALQARKADARLRSVMRGPARLRGAVKAGAGY